MLALCGIGLGYPNQVLDFREVCQMTFPNPMSSPAKTKYGILCNIKIICSIENSGMPCWCKLVLNATKNKDNGIISAPEIAPIMACRIGFSLNLPLLIMFSENMHTISTAMMITVVSLESSIGSQKSVKIPTAMDNNLSQRWVMCGGTVLSIYITNEGGRVKNHPTPLYRSTVRK